MTNLKRFAMAFLAMIVLIGGTGMMVQPAQAASCSYYHTVGAGQSLSWVGRYYGVSWTYIAQVNNIVWPYTIYPGEVLCIPAGGVVPPYPGVGKAWSYSITNVVQDKTVSIRTYNFPSNVKFAASIGRLQGSTYEWQKVSDVDSGKGGQFKVALNIPAAYAGTPSLVVRLTQAKKNISVDRWFSNIPAGSGTGGLYPWGWYYGSIPTIWIVSVVRDDKVTIQTSNFPPNLNFDVLMGPMGTQGIGGIYVVTFNSGAGGSLTQTFSIPAALRGSGRIAIRTQNLATGFFSYNWFYNNTTY